MENEIKLVNNVDGSVVSDKMTSYLDEKVCELNQAAVKIGKLEGELNVANQRLEQQAKNYQHKIDEATERAWVSIEATDFEIIKDRWGYIMDNPSCLTQIKVDKANLNDLADAGVKAQALKDVDKANKEAAEAKEKQEKAEKQSKLDLETASKLIKESDKSRKEAIEKAIEKAEKQNLSTIADQKLNLKALVKEADLLVDERNNFIKERDFALEVQDTKLRMKDNLIDILQRDTKTILDSIKNKIAYWNYSRKLHRLNS